MHKANSRSTPDAEQNKRMVQLLSEDPVIIPHDDERFEKEDSRRNFWLSLIAYAVLIILALFLIRWGFIALCGGQAPDNDCVIRWLHHLGK